MNARQAMDLLELLSLYATEYGSDCDPTMTILDLADDLVSSLEGEYAPADKPARVRDEILVGFAS